MRSEHRLSRRIFEGLSRWIVHHPWSIIWSFLLLAALSSLYAAVRLEMKTDQNDLVAADLPYNQRYRGFLKEFGDLEFLYVVIVVDGQPARAIEVVEDVAAEVSGLTQHVEGVFHRVAPNAFGQSALLLAPREELVRLAEAVRQNAAVIGGLARVDGFASLLGLFASALDPAAGERSPEAARWGFRILDASLEALAAAARGEAPPPLQARLDALAEEARSDPRQRGYLFSENGKLAFVEIMPKKNFGTLEVISEPLAQIRAALDRVRARHAGVQLGLTGRPVLQADEMNTTNQDMTYSTILAFVGVLVLFIAFFKRLRRPILAGLALCVALALTFGFVTLTLGYLTLLSIVFAAMLVGLGVDFGVVLVARYQEELLESGSVDGSMRATLLSTGMGIWTGALTTGCAFFSSIFVNFKGLAELGFVAGCGLIICLICMLTFLPALIVITDRRIQKHRVLHPPHPVTVPILAYAAARPRATLALFGALTLAGLWTFRGIPYNANLLDLQARGLESVEYEMRILEDSERSTWYSAFIADSLDGVDRRLDKLEAERATGVIDLVESIRDFVPRDQAERIEALRPARELLAPLSLPAPAASVEAAALSRSLEALLDKLFSFQDLAARSGKEAPEAVKAIEGLIRHAEGVQELLAADAAGTAGRVAQRQGPWFRELAAMVGRLRGYLEPAPLTISSLPAELRRRFLSLDGTKHLVYVYPRKDIWQEANMEELVTVMRRVDPEVTGVPIQVYESARLMHSGFLRAALYSLIMVFCLLLLDFRSLRDALITMVPVLVGVFWALELMPLLGLQFNLANFFGLPIMIGCGVDAGVHMVHRFRETGSTRDVGLTTGAAVTLANLSNMVGFASMAIARHRGVASLGTVTALGCLTVLIASVVLLPCLMELFKGQLLKPANPPQAPAPACRS